MVNILFVCSRNQWRSPTAEVVWRKFPGVSVRSAGTSSKAKRTITITDMHWADVIFVMEYKHKEHLQSKFKQLIQDKTIEVLAIPDDYCYMDPELVEILQAEANSFLGLT